MKRLYDLADFIGGCRCALCNRIISDGQPYALMIEGMIDEIPAGTVICVYCDQPDEQALFESIMEAAV